MIRIKDKGIYTMAFTHHSLTAAHLARGNVKGVNISTLTLNIILPTYCVFVFLLCNPQSPGSRISLKIVTSLWTKLKCPQSRISLLSLCKMTWCCQGRGEGGGEGFQKSMLFPVRHYKQLTYFKCLIK